MERKDRVKKVVEDLGYGASRAVSKAFLKITNVDMTNAGMCIADANGILAEVEPLQGLQELLDHVADDLYPGVDYAAKLNSGGYRTPHAVKLADKADLVQACDLLLGEATVIWKAAGGGSELPNFEGNFRQLLLRSRFNRPDGAIVNTTVRWLTARMIACSSVHQAADLYEEASLLPGASTATHLMTQHKLTVNRPLYPRDEDGPSCLLRAMQDSGRPCVVKRLGTRVSLDSSEQPGGTEAAAVRLVCDTAAVEEAIPVVQAELITLHLSADHGSTCRGPGKYAAIVMPQYCGSVAAQVQMSETAIEAGAQRMLSALEYVHSKGLVHMDVKGDNIFLDMAGDWWLGDLGSAVKVGAAVQSTTDWFSQQNLKMQPAMTQYDWYMLAVALAVEVHKADWREKLIEDGHSPAAKVVAAVHEVQKKSLLDLLQEILLRAEVL